MVSYVRPSYPTGNADNRVRILPSSEPSFCSSIIMIFMCRRSSPAASRVYVPIVRRAVVAAEEDEESGVLMGVDAVAEEDEEEQGLWSLCCCWRELWSRSVVVEMP